MRKMWSKEEEDIVREFYSKLPVKEITKILPDRSIHAIHTKANILGVSGPTGSNINYDYLNMMRKEIEG